MELATALWFDVLKYLFNNARIKPSIVQNRFYAQSGYDKEIRAFFVKKIVESLMRAFGH